ncbi:MAG: phenylalanine--tRNA ligase subunit beta, partial [Solirubrobacterales bacterium]|nr:phenylalanine--tRNA ligase subunit beta [Solirubrobacterales bacterium]
PVSRDRSREILEALDFTTADTEEGLDVKPPPPRRDDITREADVIEEVARLNGLEKLPATLPSRHGASGRLTGLQQLRRRAADVLAAQGLDEIVGWSFVSPELAVRLRLGERHAVELANPMSAEQSQLRTTLLGSMLDNAQRNRAHGAATIRLFEAGSVYLPVDGRRLPREPYHLGALVIGPSRPPSWRDPEPRVADFFAAKGLLQALLETLRVPWKLRSTRAIPFLHPGRAAEVLAGKQPVGWVGEIHPLVAVDWDLKETVASFELDLDAASAFAPQVTLYEDVTSFPEVREDLAVVVSDQVTAEQVIEVARSAGAPLLARAEVFDVYRDAEKLGAGNVSLAIRLLYRAHDRTLTDEEVAGKRAAISEALATELEGRVRDA